MGGFEGYRLDACCDETAKKIRQAVNMPISTLEGRAL